MMESGDASRRPAQLPWEPLDRFQHRNEGFFYADGDGRGTSSTLATPKSGRPCRGRPSSRAAPEDKRTLTRRGMIYEYIRAHPGAHVRGMANDLGFATGDLQYHLFWLERHGYVETRKSGFYRFVYPSKMFGESQEVLLGILSQETPREILLSLLQDSGMTQGDLARRLRHSQPTIWWHMERLMRLGAVSKRRTSRGIAYDVVADRGDVLRFVKEYHPAVWNRWASKLPVVLLSAGHDNTEGGIVPRIGLVRPALVELVGRR